MREGIKTSLLSIVCVAALSTAAHAAASVRSVGGAGAYPSASSAAAPVTSSVATSSASSSRAGSLRATGGYVRPTATISTAAKAANGSVATGDSTTSRAASAPRLSIGKYVGAPKSISQTSKESTDRIDHLESEIERLEAEKQVVLKDTDYITVTNDEVILKTDKLISDLDLHAGADGRPIELNVENDEGIKWRYVARDGEDADAWKLLVSWSDLQSHINFGDVTQYIDGKVTNIDTRFTNVEADVSGKLDKDQGGANEGKVLVVGAGGLVKPGEAVYSQQEVDQKFETVNTEITNLTNNIGDDLDGKVDKDQGAANAGKVLMVGTDGNVKVDDIVIPQVDTTVFVAKQQGASNAGHGLIVDGDSGKLELTDKPFGELAYKGLITEDDITDASITTSKVAEHAITTGKLDDGSITTSKIGEHAITNTKLASEIVSDIAKGKQAFDFVEWWETHKPTTDQGYDGQDVLLSIGPDGAPQWYLVAE